MKSLRLMGATAASLVLAAGCSANKRVTLMPTPVLYQDQVIEPFSHVAGPLRTPMTQVFYATNRAHRAHDPERPYGNRVDDRLHLGRAAVRIGAPDLDWFELIELSLSNRPDNTVPVTLEDVVGIRLCIAPPTMWSMGRAVARPLRRCDQR